MTWNCVAIRRPNIGWSAVVFLILTVQKWVIYCLLLEKSRDYWWLISWYNHERCRRVRKRVTLVHRLPTRPSAREYGACCSWLLERKGRSEGYVCYWGKLVCWTAWAHSSRNYAKRDRVHYTWKAYRRVHVLAEDFWTKEVSWTVEGNVRVDFLIVFGVSCNKSLYLALSDT